MCWLHLETRSIKRKSLEKAAIDWSKTKEVMNTNVRTLPKVGPQANST